MLKNNKNENTELHILVVSQTKKTVVAFALIAIMVFMWGKMIFKKGPETAEATNTFSQQIAPMAEVPIKISYVTLPHEEGRHDFISRDIFNANDFRNFRSSANLNDASQFDVVLNSGQSKDQKAIIKVARQLELEAIMMGDTPQAFINDKLYSVGETVKVSAVKTIYEFEVTEIKANEVFFVYVNLKDPQAADIKIRKRMEPIK